MIMPKSYARRLSIMLALILREQRSGNAPSCGVERSLPRTHSHYNGSKHIQESCLLLCSLPRPSSPVPAAIIHDLRGRLGSRQYAYRSPHHPSTSQRPATVAKLSANHKRYIRFRHYLQVGKPHFHSDNMRYYVDNPFSYSKCKQSHTFPNRSWDYCEKGRAAEGPCNNIEPAKGVTRNEKLTHSQRPCDQAPRHPNRPSHLLRYSH